MKVGGFVKADRVHHLVTCRILRARSTGFLFNTIHIMTVVAADNEYLMTDEICGISMSNMQNSPREDVL